MSIFSDTRTMCDILSGFGSGLGLVPDSVDFSSYGAAAADVLSASAASVQHLIGQTTYAQCHWPLADINDAPMCNVAYYLSHAQGLNGVTLYTYRCDQV